MVRCSCCGAWVEPHAPSMGAKALSVGLWVGILIVSPVYGAFIAINIVLLPMLIAIAWSLGVAARRGWDWTCPKCTAELPAPAPVIETAPHAPGLRPQHA
jgi:hypothetical protein